MSNQKKNTHFSRDYGREDLYFRLCVFRHIQAKIPIQKTQKEIGKIAGVSQSQYSRWTGLDKSTPFMLQLFDLCKGLNISFQEVLEETKTEIASNPNGFLNDYRNKADKWNSDIDFSYLAEIADGFISDESYDNSPDHLDRLSLFGSRRYVALFLHKSTDTTIKANELHVFTEEVDNHGFCPFSMSLKGSDRKKHTGKIISPPRSDYSYFYLTGNDPIERGIWIVYTPSNIEDSYHCGSGILLSIDRNYNAPSFERIILLEERYYTEDIKNYLYSELSEALPILSLIQEKESDEKETIPVLSLFSHDDLVEKHNRIFKRVVGTELSSIDFTSE